MITEEEISHQNNNIFDLSHPSTVPPTLILEKCVVASGLLFSTSSGSPESVGQLPRLTPGSEGSRSRG